MISITDLVKTYTERYGISESDNKPLFVSVVTRGTLAKSLGQDSSSEDVNDLFNVIAGVGAQIAGTNKVNYVKDILANQKVYATVKGDVAVVFMSSKPELVTKTIVDAVSGGKAVKQFTKLFSAKPADTFLTVESILPPDSAEVKFVSRMVTEVSPKTLLGTGVLVKLNANFSNISSKSVESIRDVVTKALLKDPTVSKAIFASTAEVFTTGKLTTSVKKVSESSGKITKPKTKVITKPLPSLRDKAGKFTSLANIQTLLNFNLHDAVKNVMATSSMPPGNYLRYQTGRFARSAFVTSLKQMPNSDIRVYYTYQRMPYQVFEGPNSLTIGKPKRNPRYIIGTAIRNLAQQVVGSRFKLVPLFNANSQFRGQGFDGGEE